MSKKASTAAVQPAGFLQIVKERRQQSMYVLAGEDSLCMESLFSALKKEFISPDTEDFNLEVLHADSDGVNAGDIISAAETVPFLGGFRLVWVRHADDLRQADLDALTTYLEKVVADPRPDLLLILTFTTLDKRTRFAKALYKADAVVECVLGEVKHPGRIAREKYGKIFTPAAESLFTELVGTDARSAHGELEKVCLFAGERETITPSDILNVCADSAARNEWELADMLLRGDFGNILEVLQNIRRSGIDPIYQHTIIAMSLSKLPAAKEAVRTRTMLSRWREFRIGRNDPHYQAICRFLESLSELRLSAALRTLMFAEIAIKGSSLPKELLADLTCFSASAPGDAQ